MTDAVADDKSLSAIELVNFNCKLVDSDDLVYIKSEYSGLDKQSLLLLVDNKMNEIADFKFKLASMKVECAHTT